MPGGIGYQVGIADYIYGRSRCFHGHPVPVNRDSYTSSCVFFSDCDDCVCARCLHYFIMTVYEVWWMLFALIGDGIMYILTVMQYMTGSPTPNTLIMILLIYLAVIGGLSSACGLSFLIW